MKRNKFTIAVILFSLTSMLFSCSPSEQADGHNDFDKKVYNKYPAYNGKLGVVYSPSNTTFRMWSPIAKTVTLKFYDQDLEGSATKTVEMKPSVKGTWFANIDGDLKGKYYTYQVTTEEKTLAETPGTYAVAVGANGMRGQVVDLASTDPQGWDQDKRPALKNLTDAILYEIHVRDISISENSGIKNKGKFIGLTETGTKSPKGVKTGIDHIEELGVTHVHLLPSYDYKTVDETKLDMPQYNWGYDPQNYNVPEGSYSTNPHDGAVRIKEFKEMVQALHKKGIRVVLDVVYNHTFSGDDSNFSLEVPGYYYRQNKEGGYSDASACGNETASDRAMMRKYMVESVLYWAKEYHLDGFRFDLMGIHDVTTMNEIAKRLKEEVDPSIIIYGEGWTANDSPLPIDQRAIKANTPKMKGVAAFSDDIRDALKGSVFYDDEIGYVQGSTKLNDAIKFGIVGSTQHDQIDYSKINYSKAPWAPEPDQTVTYVSCHDNHTLYDKLKVSQPKASEADIKKMHKLTSAIVLTSQGIPFIHSGAEMMRTKGGEHNSYNKPDAVNRLDYDWKVENKDVFQYYQGLIDVRKAHPAFRMTSTEMIQKHLKFIDFKDDHIIGYTISGQPNGETSNDIVVVFNSGKKAKNIAKFIEKGNWKILVDGKKADAKGIKSTSSPVVDAVSALVLVK
ncbi:type I pullulanase [Flammeovirga yaeyamensis]|uniref:Type I pullulanase n=1 Tax=Flammeovirga yaeyamensis TaxID=367791 RepID=A0AAX1N6J7_9BACT|nr:type I pullulanase [Flammeovirga yaeyamensis]MBB3697694.1 pullulanase [Flammeovirga yaeyamensis]NMF35946.1 type I pullulanase [Flammeovirga yaeyamensis]QWG03106.1 type I pullulanase [Flammeovirga yaeyamensis]